MDAANREWTEVIEARSSLFDIRLREIWRYRDLVLLLVRRDFVANYKQTVLGPLWFFLQPLLTSLTYLLIFSRAAGLGPHGVPPILFYLSGITVWNYFADCLNKTATVFRDNAALFGKVYFPRLTMPLSIVISGLVKLAIQLALFIAVWAYLLVRGADVHPSALVVLFPILVLLMGMAGLGLGLVVSAMTTKYKDLVFLLTFGTQLLMYATPVIIPLERVPERYRYLIKSNPLTPFVESFRFMFLGNGTVQWNDLALSTFFTLAVLALGILVFNKVERTFTDTI